MKGFKNLTILPVMILVAMLAFSVRLTGVFVGVQSLATQGSAYAAADQHEEKADAHADDEGAHMEEDIAQAHDEEGVYNEDVDEGDDEDLPVWRDAIEEDYGFENTKMDYLRDLDARRQILDAREGDLQAREALLQATEQEMERKYQELERVRSQIEVLLKEQEDAEKSQIMSLVKIYEGMKAKEAAVIFNTLDMDILLEVTKNMSERKASAVLAKMNPERAKALTVMLAEEKSLPSLQ